MISLWGKILLFGGLCATPALADHPLYSPTRFVFDEAAKPATLQLFNNGAEPLVWTARIKRWDLDNDGMSYYSETDDFSLDANEIRLLPHSGAALTIKPRHVKRTTTEKSYRLLLETTQIKENMVSVTYNHSLPIFVPSLKKRVSRSIVITSDGPGTLAIEVANDGSDHAYLEALTAVGIVGNRDAVFRAERSGWYVLPGQKSVYKLRLSASDCDNKPTLEVRATFRDGPDLVEESKSLLACDPTFSSTGFYDPESRIQPVQ
ncbi:P pilus assembly chaperone PapD [Rhizobium sp. AG855]|nr:P pilus assembly chaperone PapD [Rhizobium sp. AG855]